MLREPKRSRLAVTAHIMPQAGHAASRSSSFRVKMKKPSDTK
jgi:hypothetical protein